MCAVLRIVYSTTRPGTDMQNDPSGLDWPLYIGQYFLLHLCARDFIFKRGSFLDNAWDKESNECALFRILFLDPLRELY